MVGEAMPNIGEEFGKQRIGFFRSKQAYDAFRHAYDDAMTGLPQPTETLDVETSFGTVRAYRFGTDPRTPLVVRPGKTSSTPMWE
ncbi:MAG: hypothetical protein QOH21_3099, partial [Acidobacteriota bacterium]|nr:hypothetical protein [Acidobacteriota bacterium]